MTLPRSPLHQIQTASMQNIDEMVAAAGTDIPFPPPKRAPNKLRKKRPEASNIDIDEIEAQKPQRRRTVLGGLRNILGKKSMEAKYAAIESSSTNNNFKLHSMVKRSPDSPKPTSSSQTSLGIEYSPATAPYSSDSSSLPTPGNDVGRPVSPRFIEEDMDGPSPMLAPRNGIPRAGSPSLEMQLRDWAHDRPAVSNSDFMPVLIRGSEEEMEKWSLHIEQPSPIYPRRPLGKHDPVIKPIDPMKAWCNNPMRVQAEKDLFKKPGPRDCYDNIPVPPRWGLDGRVLKTAPGPTPDKGTCRAYDIPQAIPLPGRVLVRPNRRAPEQPSLQHDTHNGLRIDKDCNGSARGTMLLPDRGLSAPATDDDEMPGLGQRPSWLTTSSSSIFMGESLAEEWEKYVPYNSAEARAKDESRMFGEKTLLDRSPIEPLEVMPMDSASTGLIATMPGQSGIHQRESEAVRVPIELDSQVLHELDVVIPNTTPETSSNEWKSSLSQRWRAARNGALARFTRSQFEASDPPSELPAVPEAILMEPQVSGCTIEKLSMPEAPTELPTAREHLNLSFSEEPRKFGSINARLAVPTPQFDDVSLESDSAPTIGVPARAIDEADLPVNRRTASQKVAIAKKRSGFMLSSEISDEMQKRWEELSGSGEHSSGGAIQWNTHM